MRGWVVFPNSASQFPIHARRCPGLLLAIHTLLLRWGAWIHSPSWDACGHLLAGISHWHYGHFELFRVNSPLVLALIFLPAS